MPDLSCEKAMPGCTPSCWQRTGSSAPTLPHAQSQNRRQSARAGMQHAQHICATAAEASRLVLFYQACWAAHDHIFEGELADVVSELAACPRRSWMCAWQVHGDCLHLAASSMTKHQRGVGLGSRAAVKAKSLLQLTVQVMLPGATSVRVASPAHQHYCLWQPYLYCRCLSLSPASVELYEGARGLRILILAREQDGKDLVTVWWLCFPLPAADGSGHGAGMLITTASRLQALAVLSSDAATPLLAAAACQD